MPEILSREKLARLFSNAVHDKARAFLQVAYGTGLRLPELCHLRPEHIDSHADRRARAPGTATCRRVMMCCGCCAVIG